MQLGVSACCPHLLAALTSRVEMVASCRPLAGSPACLELGQEPC